MKNDGHHLSCSLCGRRWLCGSCCVRSPFLLFLGIKSFIKFLHVIKKLFIWKQLCTKCHIRLEDLKRLIT
jgi:hypothetical protein